MQAFRPLRECVSETNPAADSLYLHVAWSGGKMISVRIKFRTLLSSLTFAFLAACASPTIAPDSEPLSREVLLRAAPLTGSADLAELDDIDVLALDHSMRSFLDEHVNRSHRRSERLQELIYALISEGSFGLEYDGITRTAQQTYESRLGDCLSFTNLFVALAREVGIEVTYQEIEVPPVWSQVGDTYVLSRHVNVVIDLGVIGSKVVDFNIDDFQNDYVRHLISDERALAYYYSNIGIEQLRKGSPLEALRYFRKAIATDDNVASVWSNLGALYSQAGYFDYAEAAYLQALRINPQELVAMSNLGQLYGYRGQTELAAWYNKQSDKHRMENPYYRYQLARKAFLAEDYETAIEHLKFSIRKRKDEDTFYALMGLSYLKEGDESAARRWLEKAERVAADNDLKLNYHNKLERLFGAG
jgi:Flp pilus assembly protein TadD